MNRPIVVGVDGSEPGDSALRWACGEATRRAAELLLVHAIEWPPVELPTDPRETEEWERAGRLLADVERQARRLAPGVTVRSEPAPRGAAAALIGHAADAGLVVVGNRGHVDDSARHALVDASSKVGLLVVGDLPRHLGVVRGEVHLPLAEQLHDAPPELGRRVAGWRTRSPGRESGGGVYSARTSSPRHDRPGIRQ